MSSRTLYLMITCCVEQTRFDILKQVVKNIKDEQANKNFNIEDDIVVFDNGSTIPGTIELLTSNFKKIFRSSINEGFWSAINWVINCLTPVISKYDFVYVIESDHIHFALEKVSDIEQFLLKNPDVGGVRAQEFIVAERHLYNKSVPTNGSRTYAWVNQINHKTQQEIFIEKTDTPNFYVTDFLSQLHSVNRLNVFRSVFQYLEDISRTGKKFSELDYQLKYEKYYPKFGIIDGGLFHAKLSWNNGTIAGSYCGPNAQNVIGYQETRISIITPQEKMYVVSL